MFKLKYALSSIIQVSLSAGFGLLNANAMVSAAPYWKTVPDQLTFTEATTSNM